MLNFTHDPAAQSWVAAAQSPGCDFTLQNLPFGVFVRNDGDWRSRGGVAIGDQVLDLAHLAASGLLVEPARAACCVAADSTLNAFMALGQESWRPLRHALFKLLSSNTDAATQEKVRACMLPLSQATMKMPVEVRNYTDFYTTKHHAVNVGRVFRPETPLSPNFQWMPIAYHGRASSVVLSGTAFRRPNGRSLKFLALLEALAIAVIEEMLGPLVLILWRSARRDPGEVEAMFKQRTADDQPVFAEALLGQGANRLQMPRTLAQEVFAKLLDPSSTVWFHNGRQNTIANQRRVFFADQKDCGRQLGGHDGSAGKGSSSMACQSGADLIVRSRAIRF